MDPDSPSRRQLGPRAPKQNLSSTAASFMVERGEGRSPRPRGDLLVSCSNCDQRCRRGSHGVSVPPISQSPYFSPPLHTALGATHPPIRGSLGD